MKRTARRRVAAGAAPRGRAERRTRETDVQVDLALAPGEAAIATGVPFFDHMLEQIARHGGLTLTVKARGDLQVDAHHTVEDVAICLGQALDKALGDRVGIVRTSHSYVPMDETLGLVVVDLSGRPYAVIDVEWHTTALGSLDPDLVRHFLETLAVHARMNLHAKVLYGRNDHHQAEALFKALARALDAATEIDQRREGVPSTKGQLA